MKEPVSDYLPFSIRTYVMSSQMNQLSEMVHLSTHKTCFNFEIGKQFKFCSKF